MSEIVHKSDCAVHNEPAFPAGKCDCGAVPMHKLTKLEELIRDIVECGRGAKWIGPKREYILGPRIPGRSMEPMNRDATEFNRLMAQLARAVSQYERAQP